jgi:hypothetical protein
MSLYHFNFVDVGFFHVLGGFIPFFHAHHEMPVQTGSPLGLKGIFMLLDWHFGHGTNWKKKKKDTKF